MSILRTGVPLSLIGLYSTNVRFNNCQLSWSFTLHDFIPPLLITSTKVSLIKLQLIAENYMTKIASLPGISVVSSKIKDHTIHAYMMLENAQSELEQLTESSIHYSVNRQYYYIFVFLQLYIMIILAMHTNAKILHLVSGMLPE